MSPRHPETHPYQWPAQRQPPALLHHQTQPPTAPSPQVPALPRTMRLALGVSSCPPTGTHVPPLSLIRSLASNQLSSEWSTLTRTVRPAGSTGGKTKEEAELDRDPPAAVPQRPTRCQNETAESWVQPCCRHRVPLPRATLGCAICGERAPLCRGSTAKKEGDGGGTGWRGSMQILWDMHTRHRALGPRQLPCHCHTDGRTRGHAGS